MSESVLGALMNIEREEIKQYCDAFAVNGVIGQTVHITLNRTHPIWCSRGSLLSYSDGVEWSLKIPGGAAKAAGRLLAGEGVSLTYVEAKRPRAEVILSPNQPGKLATWDLDRGAIICTSGSFLAALGHVDIEVTVARSAGAAFFGGAGLFLQKLSGSGVAIVHGAGDFIEKQLAPGEKLLVSTGNLAVFSADVEYSIRGVGGCFKSLFGGEGLFMTELTGPGWVMLQSLKKLPIQAQAGR